MLWFILISSLFPFRGPAQLQSTNSDLVSGDFIISTTELIVGCLFRPHPRAHAWLSSWVHHTHRPSWSLNTCEHCVLSERGKCTSPAPVLTDSLAILTTGLAVFFAGWLCGAHKCSMVSTILKPLSASTCSAAQSARMRVVLSANSRYFLLWLLS